MNKITQNSNVQFQAFKINLKNKDYIQQKTANILSQNFNDIVELSKNASSARMDFFESLAEIYNKHNFYRNASKKEDPQMVLNIFDKIKKPKDIHYYIAHKFGDSFENMLRIFNDTKDEKKRLNFVKLITKEIFNGDIPKDNTMLVELLESPFSEKYIKQYKNIKPYLLLNKGDNKAVQNLDILFSQKNYDKEIYQGGYRNEMIRNSFKWKGTDILNKNIFLNHYNKYTKDLIHTFRHSFYVTDEMFAQGADKNILYILETSNKNNTKFRENIIQGFADKYQISDIKSQLDKIETLKNIFEITDNDKHAKKFINKILSSKTNYDISLNELEDIINNIPTKQLDIFHNNVINIIHQTNKANRINAIKKHIKNPFYMSEFNRSENEDLLNYGLKSRESLLHKMKLKIANYFNILRDSLNKDKTLIDKPAKTNHPVVIHSTVIETPLAENQIARTSLNKTENQIEHEIFANAEPEVEQKALTRALQKKETKNNVLDFIKSHLGEKTLEKQRDIYEKNATKMRLIMLPEIFASVADTRRADRAVGKRRINSSNKDVLDLYLRINGANKKFVNYLLKKRNVNGTRMFEVKDIIALVNRAEEKIAKKKKVNPKYKAREARKYYNHLYESKIEQYGKVQRFKINKNV